MKSQTCQPILVIFAIYSKIIKFCIARVPREVFQLYSQFLPVLWIGEAVNLFKSQPKLTTQVAETSFVVFPVAEEVDRAVQSPLYHGPGFSILSLVAKDLKGSFSVWINHVDAVCCTALFLNLCAAAGSFNEKRELAVESLLPHKYTTFPFLPLFFLVVH